MVYTDLHAQAAMIPCPYCHNHPNSPSKGRIEMDNNGPIIKCPVCHGKGEIEK